MKNKGQMVSLDLMISVVILMLAVGVVYYFLFFPQAEPTHVLALEENYFLENLKFNLDKYPANDFLDGTVVNEGNLINFLSVPDSDVEKYVLGGLPLTRELGVNSGSYDICLFFEDMNGVVDLGAEDFIGEVYGDAALTTRVSCDSMPSNPCQYYDRVISFLTPVLKDVGGSSKIVNLNLIACVLQ